MNYVVGMWKRDCPRILQCMFIMQACEEDNKDRLEKT